VAASLPSGTVTFLFTDIEGSTALLKSLGERYQPLLDRQYALIRAALERHNGAEVKTEGDAIFAAFSSADDAAAAALDAQRSLQAEPWPSDAVIRVRMGMHTGRATPVGADYVALPVNQAARVVSAAHGDQVVVSSATRGASTWLPDGASWVPLGDFNVRDFDGPETLYQLAHPDLRTDFPPPRVPPAIRHNLPTARTAFVGRAAERTHAEQLVRDHRLVSVVGAGGAGKTRLAIQAAAAMVDHFSDGVWLIELATVVDDAFVTDAVADALGIRPRPGESVGETLVDELSRRHMLLLLDNCEHLIAAVAELTDLLLSRCKQIHVLATSREPLNVAGELVWRLPSLAPPDAAALFRERAGTAQSADDLGESEDAAVETIIRRLDGIPLALELAASRLRSMTVAQLAQRLDDRFALLTGGPRTALPRQQTLRATIDWSYDLLNDHEKAVLRQLSVFVGGCTLEAAEAVCDAETPVLDVLDSLVGKSLVISRAGRYELLDTIRQYGRERLLDAGEAAATRARFAAWALEFLNARADESRYAEVEEDHDNALAAIDTAVAMEDGPLVWGLLSRLTQFWWLTGKHHIGLARVSAALGIAGPDKLRYESFFWAQELALSVREWPQMAEYSERALELREHGEPADVAGLVYHAGGAADMLGDWDAAVANGRLALEMAQASADDYRLAIQYDAVADYLLHVGGAVDIMRALSDRALDHAQGSDSNRVKADTLSRRAERALAHADIETAKRHCEVARNLALGTTLESRLWRHLALIVVAEADLAAARDCAVRATSVARDADSPAEAALGLVVLAQIELEQGTAEAAVAHLDDAVALVQQVGNRGFEARVRALRAEALISVGNHADAVVQAQQAVDLATAISDAAEQCAAAQAAAEVATATGDFVSARTHAQRAIEVGVRGLNVNTHRAWTLLANATEADDLTTAVRLDGTAARWLEEIPQFVWPRRRAADEEARAARRARLGESEALRQLDLGRQDPAFERLLRYRAQLEEFATAALERAGYSSSR
jgi:predicted ATPase/class 3 adenylate cyclase